MAGNLRWWLLVGLVTASICVSGCQANSTRWESLDAGLPMYATAVTIAVNAADPRVVMAGTYDPPALWRSDDRGDTWIRDDRGLDGGAVLDLHWDTLHRRWLVGATGGLYSRIAASDAWSRVGSFERTVHAITHDEKRRLYVADAGGGIARWGPEEHWISLAMGDATPVVLALAVSADGGDLFAGTSGRGLWVSHDHGSNWMSVNELAGDYVSTVFSDRAREITVSGTRQAYRSTDNGDSWVVLPGLTRVYALARTGDGTLYAAGHGQVARSGDGGGQWQVQNQGLRSQDSYYDLAPAPDDPNRVYAAGSNAVYRSEDSGSVWRRHSEGLGYADVNDLAWDHAGRLLAATGAGIYLHTGEQWLLREGTASYSVLALKAADSDPRLYAGTATGLLRSGDDGQTWSLVPSELTGRGITGLVVDPRYSEHLYVRLLF